MPDSLTIGLPAGGLVPGTGPGTANLTPVYATGTVVLTNANYYTGGTILQSGTLNFNGLYALGGGNYGGLMFNGGTLQYAAGFTGLNGSADLTSIGTAGLTLAAGGGTIDLNGNAVTYAGSIGNHGSGALTVKNGTLTLLGANAYGGNTTVTNTTLVVSNLSGSATGSGAVTVQNGGTLAGNGAVAGSVTLAAGGTLAPNSPGDNLTVGGNLTLANGSKTVLRVQHAPLISDTVIVTGTLIAGGSLWVTNTGGALANGDSFTLFTAGGFSGGFTNLVLPPLAGGLLWDTNNLYPAGSLSVVSLSSPLIATVQITGTSLTLAGAGGVSSWPFVLLTATNLAGPWTPVLTNQFDPAGNFNLSTTVDPAQPQTFYQLRLQ